MSDCSAAQRFVVLLAFLTSPAVSLPDRLVFGGENTLTNDYNMARQYGAFGGGSIMNSISNHHSTPRALITTLTIVFGVFGAILFVALAVLFVHFFVVDLSDYILCCFNKRRNDRTGLTPSSRCFRFGRSILPSAGCRHENIAVPRSVNNRVYRPNLVAAASSPGLPACLNFRRRTDHSFLIGEETSIVPAASPNRHHRSATRRNSYQSAAGIYSIASSASTSRLVNSSALPSPHDRFSHSRRHSFLSSFYANSVFLPDDSGGVLVSSDAAGGVVAYQLPQPPSYDDAVSSSSSVRRQQSSTSQPAAAELALSLFSWGQLPPPPAYDEVISITPRREIVTISSNNDNSNSQLTPNSTSDLSVQSVVPEVIPRSHHQQQQRQQVLTTSPTITTCLSTASASTTTPTILSSSSNYAFTNQTYLANMNNDYKPRSQRGCRLIIASNTGQIRSNSPSAAAAAGGIANASAVSSDESYDVTHVYSWHI